MSNSYSEVDDLLVLQLVQVAKLMSRFLGGSYPSDISAFIRRYVSLALDPDYRPPTRGDLISIVGKNEVMMVWLLLDRRTKSVLRAPDRYHPKEYVLALLEVWRLLSTNSKI